MEIIGKMFLEYESTTEGPLDRVVDIPEGVLVDQEDKGEFKVYKMLDTENHEVPVKLGNDNKGLFVSFDFSYPDFSSQDVIFFYINGPFDGDELVAESGNDIYSMNTRNLLMKNSELIITGGLCLWEWDKDIYHQWKLIMLFEDEVLHKYFSKENVEWII